MLQGFIRSIMWAGIDPRDKDNINAIRIINTISCMISLVMLIQLPTVIYFWSYAGWPVLILLAVYCLLFLTIPLLNHFGRFLLARSVLMIGFISYICFSSLFWSINLHFHYFLLIGLFVSPFIYQRWEASQIAPNCVLYFISYLLIEIYWMTSDLDSDSSVVAQGYIKVVISMLLFLATLISSLLVRNTMQISHLKLAQNKYKVEALLQRALPRSLYARLTTQTEIKPIVERYQASVLFADIQGYTALCQQTSPARLVALLDDLFSQFDALCHAHGLEKIKTNGDQYMVVTNVYDPHDDDALSCCQFAMAMRDCFNTLCQSRQLELKLRIGIASGEVFAGSIGREKLTFDVWGETVNLAARMESQGSPNQIQICQQTYDLLQGKLETSKTSEICFKGIGTLSAFWLADKSAKCI